GGRRVARFARRVRPCVRTLDPHGKAADPRGRMALRSRSLALLVALAGGCTLLGSDPNRPPPPPQQSSARAPAPPPLPNGRLPITARPLRYAVSLVIDPSKDRFTGNVGITLDVPAPTQVVVMHGRDLVVSRAEAMSDGQSIAAEASTRMAAGTHEAPDELV